MKFRAQFAIVLLLLVPALSHGMDLKPETLQAWDDYIQAAKLRMEDRAP